MPYKPTGRPPGRPKTKEYETLTARVPQDIADQARKYATHRRQTLSDVLRDGLYLLLEDNRYRPFMSDTNSAPEIVSDMIVPENAPENMSDTNGTSEIASDMIRMQRLREIVSDAIQSEEKPEIVSDTNGTHPVSLDYDPSKYILLPLCKGRHAYQDTGMTLMRKTKRDCPQCAAETKRAKRAAHHG